MKQTRLFKITTPESTMHVIVEACTEAEAEKQITEFVKHTGYNPLAVYVTLIDAYIIGEKLPF